MGAIHLPADTRSFHGHKFKVLGFPVELPAFHLTTPFDSRDFFRTREGLEVESMERVLRGQKVVSIGDARIKYCTVIQSASDLEIQLESPVGGEFKLWIAARLLELQWNGEEGPLLTNGGDTIFYARGYVLRIRRRLERPSWLVREQSLSNNYWPVGTRVFSRKNKL